MHKLSNKLCAVKSVNKRNLKTESAFMKLRKEMALMEDLRHPNIVKLYETFQSDNHELMFMELCAGGDLLQFIRKRRKLEESMAKLFMRQIIEAIGYLHAKDIVHRDIKLENILLDNMGTIKICDLGVSHFFEKERDSKGRTKGPKSIMDCCGSPAYMAPEVIILSRKL